MKKKKQFIVMNGFVFKPSTFYNVEVAMHAGNPIFQEIFYTGFLDSNGWPAGYNQLLRYNNTIDDVLYMKIISQIDNNIENDGRMVKDVLMAEYPEKLIG